MFCSPASSNSATNGVVFQTSARMSGIQAATASANQVGAANPRRASTAEARPAGLSNMKRQTSAATTVGIAHGSSTAVRTSPAARETRSSASASTSPPASSSVTEAAANTPVCAIALQNRRSASAST